MPKVPYPTEHKLTKWTAQPSAKHEHCMDFYLETWYSEGWALETKKWVWPEFKQMGTSQAKVTLEPGFLIVENEKGEKASLKLPRYVNPAGPIVEVSTDLPFVVTLPQLVPNYPAKAPVDHNLTYLNPDGTPKPHPGVTTWYKGQIVTSADEVAKLDELVPASA
uniref:Uncharacterized protein n=1 Tax=Haptolina brevifila TaxID=156173 RepID=A0A7S2MP96_9EUKA|mmetsp:Transcript_55952/g.111049  ORF Transcript_55952/g.111049 Transcript_55952/m.111049 type:complete len:164 (+) Transcript_55952:50-541(+)